MQGNNRKRSRAAWARGFAALWAALIVAAAGGGASAAPTLTVLHAFQGGSEGARPSAGLYADSSGNLYGTTSYGGASNFGEVFKLSPGGTETVLHAFTGGLDGRLPAASLIADSSGNLYGTTVFGGGLGSACGKLGCGVVFKVSPSGTETVLHTFTGDCHGHQHRDDHGWGRD